MIEHVRHENGERPGYVLDTDPESGQVVASVLIDDTTYSVVIPKEIDKKAILDAKKRSSRTSFIEELMGTPFETPALVNRAIIASAAEAYDEGDLPREAWREFRVAGTLFHDELLRRQALGLYPEQSGSHDTHGPVQNLGVSALAELPAIEIIE